jgi:hypothetical protein
MAFLPLNVAVLPDIFLPIPNLQCRNIFNTIAKIVLPPNSRLGFKYIDILNTLHAELLY